LAALHHAVPDGVFVSAATGEGIDELLTTIMEIIASGDTEVTLQVPYSRGDIVSRVHAEGAVLEETHTQDGTRIRVRLPKSVAGELNDFVHDGTHDGAP